MDNALIWNVRSINTQKAFTRLLNLHKKVQILFDLFDGAL